MKGDWLMEIHFPHLTNGIPTTHKQRRLITSRRLLKTTVALVLCSAAVLFAACNVGGGGY